MYHIFLESLGKIQFNYDDVSHHDHLQECQDDQDCHTSEEVFFNVYSSN